MWGVSACLHIAGVALSQTRLYHELREQFITSL